MYHYVRPRSDDLPYLRYLALDDFRRQLDHLGERYGFVERGAFLDAVEGHGPLPEGVLPTFDDGFVDHHAHVAPELEARGLFGVFYVPTGPPVTGRALDVHRVHHLLGLHGGPAMLARLGHLVEERMLTHRGVEEFRSATYVDQDDHRAATRFKRILNYLIDDAWRTRVIDALMDEATAARLAGLYLDAGMVRDLQGRGHLVGSHTVTHRVSSTLPVEVQREEIEASFAWLDEATGGLPCRTFCHPYGGFHTFTDDTERLLDAAGCRFAFNVEPRDVTDRDLRGRPQALPRWDCNAFPHGHPPPLPAR